MIKAKKEAKLLKTWLACITIFLILCITAVFVLGIFSEERLYDLLPWLDFGVEIESLTVFGFEIPEWFCENSSLIISLGAVYLALILLSTLIHLFALWILSSQRKRAKRILRKKGYCKEYFDVLEAKRARLSGKSLSAENDLLVAKEYADGRCYDNAFAVLRDINTDGIDSKMAVGYYCLYAYLFVMTGDIEASRKTLDLAKTYWKKKKPSSSIVFIKALILYAEGRHLESKDVFKTLLETKNNEIRVWSGMYLSLIYLRLHHNDRAKKLAVALSAYKKTPRQSEDMLKLLKKIEQAYAIEASEKSEAGI